MQESFVEKYIELIFNKEYTRFPEYVDYNLFKNYFFVDFYNYFKNSYTEQDNFPNFTVIAFWANSFDPGAGFGNDYICAVEEKYRIPAFVKLHYNPNYKPTREEYELNEHYFGFYIHKNETDEEVDELFENLRPLDFM